MSFSRAPTASSILLGSLRRTAPTYCRAYSSSSSSSAMETAARKPLSRIPQPMMNNDTFTMDITSQIGACMPLSMMRIGTLIQSVEMRPGQGAKLVRAAGTLATILTQPNTGSARYCEIKLPSGVKKSIDVRCKAVIGDASDVYKKKKLYKAGQNRWRGIRPHVRGVAMNPVDHPHGGGEGKSKSSGSHGKCSRTPWGKPCKGGYKTGPNKRKK